MTIPSTNSKLLITEDWTKIYQSKPNAEFQSYDFDTLRRILITYLQENYPEDFNDFIESSEYIALVDLIAYLGQNLSFRIDLNARENFLETAKRRDSILRLAQLISYIPKRNVPASGLLKISAIATTGNVLDATGVNLANNTILWNDATNPNWYSQFMTIMNNAMPGTSTFGRPYASGVVGGTLTEQYLINSSNRDVPIYSFTQNINGSSMNFEIVPATFSGQDYIYEDVPRPGNPISLVYQNDNQGSGSKNTGFFAFFKQGSMSASSFSVTNPVPNEIVGINISDINNTDTWLWQIDAVGNYGTIWTKVPAISGSSVIYNSLLTSNRNIYSVTTRDQDQIDLNFADGNFGNLPNGQFQLFYRQSNGGQFTIKPEQMSGIVVNIPYVDKSGLNQTLSLVLNLEYTVSNSAGSETNASIKQKAPQSYYTQNRMVTGEDYNIAPLTYTTDVIKVKSVNRQSSGISKYFELSDVSGRYSSTNIFCDDGTLAKNTTSTNFTFNFASQNDIWNTLKNTFDPLVSSTGLYSFYLDTYRNQKSILTDATLLLSWKLTNSVAGQSRGYFLGSPNGYNVVPTAVGPVYSSISYPTYYITPGALIKFAAPLDVNGNTQYFMPDGTITNANPKPYNASQYLWSTVQQVIGTGSNNGLGNLSDGTGPIILSNVVPDSAIPIEIVPTFINSLGFNFETNIVNLCLSKQSFGLSIDSRYRTWYIITANNLDQKYDASDSGVNHMFDYANDTTGTNKDASWLIKFIWEPSNNIYRVTIKNIDYLFQSSSQTGFYVDSSRVNFDYTNNTVIKDKITVLSVNPHPVTGFSLPADYQWQINKSIVEPDGYIDPSLISISYYQHQSSQQFSYIDNPDAFNTIIGYNNGMLNTATVKINGGLAVKSGRSNLKFQYQHNPSKEVRVDPAKSNIIDIYMLTADYDASFRNWLSNGSAGARPLPPTSGALENNYAYSLDPIKTISDQIIYQPASYKVLFGNSADINLRATFKAVKSDTTTLSDNAIIAQILDGINSFFSLENWDFGKSFYFSELSTYIMNLMSPNVTNFLIIPTSSGFGNLYEVSCQNNEIFISGARASNIQVINAVTSLQLNGM
jgi:hypothetical protein